MTIASHKRRGPFSQRAFASRERSLFPCAPRYSRNSVPSVGRDRRPLGVLRPRMRLYAGLVPCFAGLHGSVFTPGPSLGNPYTI
jgi:hypothetical protein